MMDKSILFVCLGNICRSPLAEAIARDIIVKRGLDIIVDSAGTSAWHIGEAPCDGSQKIAKEHGIDISTLKARQVNKDDFQRFDRVIALDSSNQADLITMGGTNIIKLRYYDGTNSDVPDPYFFNGYEGFDKVYKIIERAVSNLLDEIEKSG